MELYEWYETATTEVLSDYFNDMGYTLTCRTDKDVCDYEVTSSTGETVLLEAKSRPNVTHTTYEEWFFSNRKLQSLIALQDKTGKRAFLIYLFPDDDTFFIQSVDELNTYPTKPIPVTNPMNGEEVELEVCIPADIQDYKPINCKKYREFFHS